MTKQNENTVEATETVEPTETNEAVETGKKKLIPLKLKWLSPTSNISMKKKKPFLK